MENRKIPTTLKHKPVVVAEDYSNIDGRLAYHTDAKGLSLGLAQWSDRGNPVSYTHLAADYKIRQALILFSHRF